MATGTTEIVTLPMVPGGDIGDPASPAAEMIKQTCDTLNQQDGLQQIHFGKQVESPDTVQMFMNWQSKGHHEAFMASPAYQPFKSRIMSTVSGPPSIFHVDFCPSGGLTHALSAPVTEKAVFYFESDSGDAAEDWAVSVQEWMAKVQTEGADSAKGFAAGLSHEEMEGEGGKGKIGVIVIGWPSVEEHMAFRETSVFKDNVGMLRKGVKGAEMRHVAFMQYVE